jgi:hypothetical protein
VLRETTASSANEELKAIRERLVARAVQIGKLGANWDSYDAQAIRPAALDAALLLAVRSCVFLVHNNLPLVEPFLVPTPAGGVGLEWAFDGSELEVEIEDAGKLSYLAVEGEKEDEGTCPEPKCFQLLRWLVAGKSG